MGAQDAAGRGHTRSRRRRPAEGGRAGGEPGRCTQEPCGAPLHAGAGAQPCLTLKLLILVPTCPVARRCTQAQARSPAATRARCLALLHWVAPHSCPACCLQQGVGQQRD